MSYKFFYTNMGVIGGVSQAVEPTDAELECQKLTFSIFHFRPLLLASTKILYASAYIYNRLAWGVELRELRQFETVDSSIYGICGCAKSWEKDSNSHLITRKHARKHAPAYETTQQLKRRGPDT
jgi:hypothetical protein